MDTRAWTRALPVAKVYEDVLQLWPQTGVGSAPTLNVAYGGLDGESTIGTPAPKYGSTPFCPNTCPAVCWSGAQCVVKRPRTKDFNVIRVAKTATELSRAGVKARTVESPWPTRRSGCALGNVDVWQR